MIEVERKTSTRNSPNLRHDIPLIHRYASVRDETNRQEDLMATSIKITPENKWLTYDDTRKSWPLPYESYAPKISG